MNYYAHHIGDFDRATRHLTRLERSVYRDLIDVYYDTEQRLTRDQPALCRKVIARTNEEVTAVEQTLNEFFTKTSTGWYHARCEDQLESYRNSSNQKSLAGKASAAKRALKHKQALNELAPGVEQTLNGTPTNQEPVTKNQEPVEEEHKKPPHTPPAGLPQKSSAVTLQTYLDKCKAADKLPIPEDDSVFAYAASAGIPQGFLKLAWREFKERYAAPDAKRYKAWPSVFAKSVRGNWFKLWYVDNSGGYALTTAGQQAQRRHKEAA